MSEQPFKKFNENMKKNWEKFDEDFRKFFKIPPKKAHKKKSLSQNQNHEYSSENSIPIDFEESNVSILDNNNINEKIEKNDLLSLDVINDNWNKFIKNSRDNFLSLQQQWKSTYDKITEKSKVRNQKTKEKIEENNQKMIQFFKDQQAMMNQTFIELEQISKARKVQNRKKFFENLNKASDNWNKFVITQQKQFDRNLNTVNRMSWRNNTKFFLILIPIFIIVVLIFSMIKPFL